MKFTHNVKKNSGFFFLDYEKNQKHDNNGDTRFFSDNSDMGRTTEGTTPVQNQTRPDRLLFKPISKHPQQPF